MQNVKTAIHEITHATLHNYYAEKEKEVPPEQRKDQRTREVEAESVAYTVCQHYGIETSDYSFGYIAGWSSDKQTKELKASLATIRETAAGLIDSIDGAYQEIVKGKEQVQVQAAPVQEAPGQGEPDADPDTFNIYQLKGGDALHYHHFTGLDQLKKEGLKVEFENYEKVYSGPWTRGDKLEGIYERFNIDRPEDFTGHSLSVSDVVVLHRGGKDTSYYVDSTGFTELDVLAALQSIMEQNTGFYQDDLKIDRDTLTEAAEGRDPNGKTFLWLSRPSGTQCNPERLVLMGGTASHNTWRHFAEQTPSDRILAYAVELSGVEGGKVRGDLYELDYPQYAAYIQKAADPVESVRVTYPDGQTEKIPYQEFRRMDMRPFKDAEILYESKHPEQLQALLSQNHADRVRQGRPADLQAHVQDLRDGLVYHEAVRLTAAIAERRQPDSLDKAFFAAEISPHFTQLATSRDYDRLLACLPYRGRGKQLSHRPNHSGLYLFVHKDEARDRPAKHPPARKQSIKAKLEAPAPKQEAKAARPKDREAAL